MEHNNKKDAVPLPSPSSPFDLLDRGLGVRVVPVSTRVHCGITLGSLGCSGPIAENTLDMQSRLGRDASSPSSSSSATSTPRRPADDEKEEDGQDGALPPPPSSSSAVSSGPPVAPGGPTTPVAMPVSVARALMNPEIVSDLQQCLLFSLFPGEEENEGD